MIISANTWPQILQYSKDSNDTEQTNEGRIYEKRGNNQIIKSINKQNLKLMKTKINATKQTKLN